MRKPDLFMSLQPSEDRAKASCGCVLEIVDGDPAYRMCEAHLDGPSARVVVARFLRAMMGIGGAL